MTERDKVILAIVLLSTLCTANKGLKNLSLSVEPSWVRRGQSAQLYCHYEVVNTALYSVKWYRGTLEFYRYTLFENPPSKVFAYTGIKVDISASNATHVTLRNVGFNLSGNFTCEVTADESTRFYTSTATNTLTVVELPHMPPTLWTEHTKYDPGDILRANCSTPPSRPSASITFIINQMSVGDSPTIYHQTHENLQWSSRDLQIQILPSHYHNGQLILRCTAEVGALYAEHAEAPLETTRKEPIPERVTSPSRASLSRSWHLALVWTLWIIGLNFTQFPAAR